MRRRPRHPRVMLLLLPLLPFAACEEQGGVRVYETTPVAAYDWPDTPATEGSAEGLVWEVPAGAVTQADVPDALVADYRLPGTDQRLPGRLTVSVLPGDGGGLEANVSRWADQLLALRLEAVAPLVTVSPVLPHPYGVVWFVDIRGHDAGELVPDRMRAALITLQDRQGRAYSTWSVKLTGDDATVERWTEAMSRVVYSLRPEGTPMPDLDAPVDLGPDPHEGVPGAPALPGPEADDEDNPDASDESPDATPGDPSDTDTAPPSGAGGPTDE